MAIVEPEIIEPETTRDCELMFCFRLLFSLVLAIPAVAEASVVYRHFRTDGALTTRSIHYCERRLPPDLRISARVALILWENQLHADGTEFVIAFTIFAVLFKVESVFFPHLVCECTRISLGIVHPSRHKPSPCVSSSFHSAKCLSWRRWQSPWRLRVGP